jgi:dihydroneopterin aldolase
MFTITLNQLKLPVKIGWSAGERVGARIIEATITLEIDAPQAAKSDELADTVDYDQIISTVRSVSCSGEWNLLERLSAELAMSIIESYPKVSKVEIALTKNIHPELKSVTVTHSRSRAEIK